ncbi:MAG: hypothetical protein WCS15_11040 [Prevotella sp.]
MKNYSLKSIFRLFGLISLVTFAHTAKAQLYFSGYIKDLQTGYCLNHPVSTSENTELKSTGYQMIHNRLNLEWQATEGLHFATSVRNRWLWGPMIKVIPDYAQQFANDKGLIDLSYNVYTRDNHFLNTALDRLYVDYTYQKLQLTIGRQRINWGINTVWNPNDIFNAYSYFDFDYEERPGSDAILFTWYTSSYSNLDLVAQAAPDHQSTFAARYRFNVGSYDWQIIGGKFYDDFVLGGGWSGIIGDVAFTGEGSFFCPSDRNQTAEQEEAIVVSLSFNYTFSQSLTIQFSSLYNSTGTSHKGQSLSLLDPSYEMDAKHLSIGRYELYGNVSYPFNPIFSGAFSAMVNPTDGSCYLGPTTTLSLANNVDLMLLAQLMLGTEGSEYGAMGGIYAGFARLRWNF